MNDVKRMTQVASPPAIGAAEAADAASGQSTAPSAVEAPMVPMAACAAVLAARMAAATLSSPQMLTLKPPQLHKRNLTRRST